ASSPAGCLSMLGPCSTLCWHPRHAGVLQVLLEWALEQGRDGAAVRALTEHADSEGWTALRSAAWGGHKESVKVLLEAGAEVDGCDADGRTALRAASWGGHEEILLTLIAHGAEVDRVDYEGRTPLIAAAYMGHKEVVELLLRRGAYTDVRDVEGRPLLYLLVLEGDLDGIGDILFHCHT
uniref:Uncharacterized protein n=1 Tax=Electrophorus electricus TaxID=8005 RepID=A0AAY5EMW6_ELEEL